MTLLSRLDVLEAAGKRATKGPWVHVSLGTEKGRNTARGKTRVAATDRQEGIVTEADVGGTSPSFDSELIVSAVNLAPSLSAIARAAVARPWWRGGFEDDAGFDIWRCDGCDAPKDAPGDYAPHREPCRYSALDAAIDAAEGTE